MMRRLDSAADTFASDLDQLTAGLRALTERVTNTSEPTNDNGTPPSTTEPIDA